MYNTDAGGPDVDSLSQGTLIFQISGYGSKSGQGGER